MTKRLTTALLLGSTVLGTASAALAQDKTITIESWRNDDLAIWQEKLIPAFEAKNPGIKVLSDAQWLEVTFPTKSSVA